MYQVKQGQSIYDLALQFGYGIERVVEFAKLAGVSSLNDVNLGGLNINVTPLDNKLANNLNLQVLATNTTDLNYLLTDDGDIIETDDGFSILL